MQLRCVTRRVEFGVLNHRQGFAPALSRLTTAFQTTGSSVFIWGKVHGKAVEEIIAFLSSLVQCCELLAPGDKAATNVPYTTYVITS